MSVILLLATEEIKSEANSHFLRCIYYYDREFSLRLASRAIEQTRSMQGGDARG